MTYFRRAGRCIKYAGRSHHAALLFAGAIMVPTIAQADATKPAGSTQAVMLWAGPYGGIVAGYEASNRAVGVTTSDPQGSLVDPSGLTQVVLLPGSLAADRSSAFAGAELGYNALLGRHVLLGIEADLNAVGKTARGVSTASFTDAKQPVPNYTSLNTAQTRINYLSTVRARLGYAIGPVLGYATAGLAFGRVKSAASFAISNTGNPPSDTYSGNSSKVEAGYSIGGGLEYMLSPNISVKAEYLYYQLNTLSYTASPDTFTATDQPGVSQGVSYRPTGQFVRVGVNFHFR